MSPENLMTPQEAASRGRCHVKTVRRAYQRGHLTAYRRNGSRCVLLREEDVAHWLLFEELSELGATPTIIGINDAVAADQQQKARRVKAQAEGVKVDPTRTTTTRVKRAPALGTPTRTDLSSGALSRRRAAIVSGAGPSAGSRSHA